MNGTATNRVAQYREALTLPCSINHRTEFFDVIVKPNATDRHPAGSALCPRAIHPVQAGCDAAQIPWFDLISLRVTHWPLRCGVGVDI